MSAWRAELLKIVTVRGQFIGAILATAAMPLTSLLVAATGRLGAGDTATSGAATGSVVGLLAFGAWGAVFAASEYATGTIVVSLATVPRRPVFYAAKLLAAATVAGTGALLSATIALFGVLAVSPGHHALGNPAALISVVLVMITVTVVAAAVGIITRSPSASIVIVVAAVLLPDAAGGLLGRIQPWVVGASPGTVITEVVASAQLPTSQIYPAGAWAAAATMVLIAAVLVAAGAIALMRRDG
jgi:ABC-2 type transport system permease protein